MKKRKLPPGVRILVAAAHDLGETERGSTFGEHLKLFARALGRELMRGNERRRIPNVIITGGRGGPYAGDVCVVEGARAELEGSKAPGSNLMSRYAVTFPNPRTFQRNELDGFADTQVERPAGASRQARRFDMTGQADVVVSIAGTQGTLDCLTLALAREVPILPLPFTEGASRRIWKSKEDTSLILETSGLPAGVARRWKTLDLSDMNGQKVAQLARRVVERARAAAILPCFVMMPYKGPVGERLFEEVVDGACRDASMRPVRSDHSRQPGRIDTQMLSEIRDAAAAVAIVSDARMGQQRTNPNVMYELGYAHALGKPTVILAEDPEALPFDLRGHRTFSCRQGEGLWPKLRSDVAEALRSVRTAR